MKLLESVVSGLFDMEKEWETDSFEIEGNVGEGIVRVFVIEVLQLSVRLGRPDLVNEKLAESVAEFE